MTKRIATIADLTPDPQNANRGTERGRGMLEASLRKYGAGRSVLADKHGTLIAGNKTVEGAAEIGLPIREVHTDGRELVVVVRDDLDLGTDKAARELAYADNRVSQVSLEWELAQIGADVEAGVDLSALFTTDELAALLNEAAGPTEGLTDPDAVPGVPDAPITNPGDLWTLGRHRLACIDATNPEYVDRLIGGADVAMVYTDPPYGISIVSTEGHVGADKLAKVRTYAPVIGDETTQTAIDAYNLCAALAIPSLIFWGGNHYASALPDSSCWLVWDKRDGMAGNNFADCELAWTNLQKAARLFAHRWSGMLMASERGERVHPTQKPVALAVWAFDEFGQRGDVVLDLFGGSGSTLIAAEQSGRTALIGEISPAYCDVIVARWEAFTGGKAVRHS